MSEQMGGRAAGRLAKLRASVKGIGGSNKTAADNKRVLEGKARKRGRSKEKPGVNAVADQENVSP